MKTVMVAGDFGKLHSGHLMHIAKAYKLGDWLYIVTHEDESIERRKGYRPDPLKNRIFMLKTWLKGLGNKGEIIIYNGEDGLVADMLRKLKPAIFAKGGEYDLGNMPIEELEACGAVNCDIVFGVGDRLNESRLVASYE